MIDADIMWGSEKSNKFNKNDSLLTDQEILGFDESSSRIKTQQTDDSQVDLNFMNLRYKNKTLKL